MLFRQQQSLETRRSAADLAASRPPPRATIVTGMSNACAVIVARLAVLANMEAAFAGSSGIGSQLDVRNGAVDNWLLPMAFPEGSPTHPSYGAGHATVAAACVTILKAWFDHGWELRDTSGMPIAYVPNANRTGLIDVSGSVAPLTVEGELNKLGANISIGRDWAGVHYYSDYYESFRLGEQVAIGLLKNKSSPMAKTSP